MTAVSATAVAARAVEAARAQAMAAGPRRLAALRHQQAATGWVWYAAFGSNMRLSRLGYYLVGGRPPEGRRRYPGCRDPRGPLRAEPVLLPGTLYFALESRAWTGGMAFYDPLGEGTTAARAYLVTAQQFSDLAAQEMYREPGADLDLGEALATGRATLGPGRYETLVCPGLLDGHPVLTLTAPWGMADVPWNAPAAAYLRQLALGLAEAHGWPAARIAEYLVGCPGAAPRWTPEAVSALCADGDPTSG